MVGVAFSLGFLLGPSIGAYFSIGARLYNKFDPWPARLAIALSLLEMALIAVWMPETLATMKEEGKEASAPPPAKYIYLYPSHIPPFSTPLPLPPPHPLAFIIFGP
jgi:hypothetical protein